MYIRAEVIGPSHGGNGRTRGGDRHTMGHTQIAEGPAHRGVLTWSDIYTEEYIQGRTRTRWGQTGLYTRWDIHTVGTDSTRGEGICWGRDTSGDGIRTHTERC